MSTSVNCVDGVKRNTTQVDKSTIRTRRETINPLRKLMNRLVGKSTERRAKQTEVKGLVKGGLTPTFQRRERSPEVTPGEITKNVTYSRGSSFDSTSRPLMTQPVLQDQLPQWDVTPGLLGIYNHGNTCFMNTILQCLSNSDVVSDYFIRKKFKEVLSVKGIAKKLVKTSKGEVTEQLGCLLESLWSGKYTPDISNQFKSVVSKYNVQYKGSSQHDAQEFLLWLLDRINEELHHSTTKKAKETLLKSKKDKHGELSTAASPEMVLSMSSGFEVYNRFQALYQSSLTCPNCVKQSNSYETYLCLSLPVPQKTLRPVYITVVYIDDSPKQLKIALELNALDTIKELREKLAYELDVPPKRLVLCQVHEDGFRNTYGDDQPLSDIHESETVYMFETYPFSDISKPVSSYELLQILLIHVKKISTTKSYRFCSPQVMRIPRDIDFITLQKYILSSMGLAVSEEVVEQSSKFESAIFRIRVIDSGASDCYLPIDVDMPLYTQAIDRAISTYVDCVDFGPPHVKFVIEWEPKMKDRIVDNDENLQEEHQSVHKVRLSQQQPSSVSLDECLKLFTKEEQLGEDDAWNCPHCNKERQRTIKRLGLWSAPDILVIHLKRFRHSGLRRNKLNILVNFPITDLQMSDHLLPRDSTCNHDNGPKLSDMYDLYAVSNHYGNMNGGHYTAFCKNLVDSQWYEFDDTHVKPLHQKEIVSRAAYLLFYQRKKLTNSTIEALHSSDHWVFHVYGPPRSPRDADSTVTGDRGGYNGDMVDGQKNRERLNCVSDRGKDLIQSRAKSEPYRSRADETDSAEYLRREINSPKRDERPSNMEINSPRQEMRNKSRDFPRKQLYVNLDQAPERDKPVTNEVSRKSTEKASVAEQILRSTSGFSQEQMDGHRAMTRTSELSRDMKTDYCRTDSVDSSKNSYSYTSSSEISHGSPLDEFIRHNPPSANDQSSVDNRHGNLLNNERSLFGNSNTVSNTAKLKMHSNQIHKDVSSSKMIKNDSRPYTAKNSNQKLTNTNSNFNNDNKPAPLPKRDMFSTPQQTRKSPSPPVMNGRGPWSTPQPQRKQYSNSDTRPPMDRQFSAPARGRPQSSYDGQYHQEFENQGRVFLPEQPHSLPMDAWSIADKPPLPKPSQSSSRQANMRPTTAHVGHRVPVYNDSRASNTNEPLSVSGTGIHIDGREFDRDDLGKMAEVYIDGRERNKSVERQYDNSRRSMRVPAGRPRSYHNSSHNDYYNQYYLSQPTPSFDRSSKYATMKPLTTRHDHYSEEDSLYQGQQLADQQYLTDLQQMQQPRSRAPFSYNPSRYQDRPSADMHRYKPHLHEAKFMSKIAMDIQQREMQKKMKSQYLKESSV